MDGIDHLVVKDHLITMRGQAINNVHRLSRMTGQDDPCLNRDQIQTLCDHFNVKTLAEVFEQLDVIKAVE